MTGFLQDLRYSLRGMRKAPGFFLIAVLTLALGIGANTAIFSIVNAVLIRPLPYDHPEQLVSILESNPRRGLPITAVSPANFVDWQHQATSFSSMAAAQWMAFSYTGNSGAVRIDGAQVSSNMFELLRVSPILGRSFQQQEEEPGRDNVVLISESLWHRQFGSDPHILNQAVTMSGQRFSVIGVMPGWFHFPFAGGDIWKPLAFTNADLASRSEYRLSVYGRLRDGVSITQARSEMESISRRLEHDYPDSNAGVSVSLRDLHEAFTTGAKTLVFVLFGAVLTVLLIACVNIAGLLSVRSMGRQHEMALRSSLGATRSRLVRQFLTESVLLGCAGGTLGVLLAIGGLRLLLHFLPPFSLPSSEEIGLDGRVLLFTLALSIVCGVLFGIVPAWRGAHSNPVDGLREGGRGASGSRSHRVFQTGLVVCEVGLSLVSLVVAGLLVRSFVGMLKIDPGFRSDGVLVNTQLVLPTYKYPQNYQRVQFFKSLMERTRALPGVEAVGGITSLPLQGNSFFIPFRIQGQPVGPDGKLFAAVLNVVSPGYFSTMQIPLERGRIFSDGDNQQAAKVAIINDVAAKNFFAGADPLGQNLFLTGQGEQPFTVVGVVGSSRQFDITSPPSAEIFTNYEQSEMSYMYVLVRTAGDPAALIPTMRRAVAEIDPEQPVGHRTLVEQMDNAVSEPRFYTLLMGLFAGLALLLAGIGVYGAMSHAVSQRTQEIGVRMALGARRGDVLQLFLRQGFKVALMGVVLGLILAVAAGRVLATLLFNVKPTDAIAFAGAALLLIMAVLIANYVPARRATRVDPLLALRNE
jgi:putative ABC transport system permease protein